MRVVVLADDDDALQLDIPGKRDVEQKLLVGVRLHELQEAESSFDESCNFSPFFPTHRSYLSSCGTARIFPVTGTPLLFFPHDE